MSAQLKKLLIRYEGNRSMPYRCTMGKWTIGVGHNLEAMPLSERARMVILDDDTNHFLTGCVNAFAWFNLIDVVRQDVIVIMAFQLGVDGLKEFKKFCEAMSAQNYAKAAEEMMDSAWAKQTPNRALELQTMMRAGKYPADMSGVS